MRRFSTASSLPDVYYRFCSANAVTWKEDASMPTTPSNKPDYGGDAPKVLRNFFLWGIVCLAAGFLLHNRLLHVGQVVFVPAPMFLGTGIVLVIEGLLFVLYVKFGKFRHRDQMLA